METVALAYDVYETSETQKDKYPIIFLHGLFWNKYMLRDLAESMCHLTMRKVFCLDLRCHDQSPFRKEWKAEIMAEDVKRFIRDNELEKIAFVCHSYSCTIAYMVLLDEVMILGYHGAYVIFNSIMHTTASRKTLLKLRSQLKKINFNPYSMPLPLGDFYSNGLYRCRCSGNFDLQQRSVEPEVVEKVIMIDHPPYRNNTEASFKIDVLAQFQIQNRYLETLDPSLSLSAAKRKIMNLSEGASTEGQRIFLKKIAYELIKVNNQFKWKTDHKFLIDGYLTNCLPPCTGRSDHEILIIRGKRSTLVTDEKFETIRKYNPNASLKTIDDASHLLMFEKPDEFLEVVREYLS